TIDRSHAQTTSFVYDAFGDVIETLYPDGTTTSATYDAFGNKVSSTDQLGNTTNYSYNQRNELIAVALPAVPNPADGGALSRPTYSYSYDALGNQTSITAPNGGVTTFTYDNQGNELSRTLPDGETETFEYDGRGRQILHVSFEGTVTRTSY